MNTRKRLNRCGALSLAMITIMTSPRRTRNFEPGATALAPVVAAPVAATTPLETSSLIAFEMARAPEKTVEPSAVSAATRPTASRVAGVRRAAPARTSADTTAVAVMGAATVQGQGQGQGQGQAEAGPAPLFPSTPVARVVYVCPMDSYIATKPGVCPICHEPLVPMALGNADPRRGEATGAVIEHPIYAMVDGKPYAFASAQGLQQMLKHPLDYLHAAEDRARLEQDLTAVAWRRTRAG